MVNSLKNFILNTYRYFNNSMAFLAPVGDLFIRYWIASIFFYSGLTKLQSWQSTIMLFQYEYHVPLISAKAAAYLGTATELIVPVLLLFGLAGRIPGFILFIFNIVAVYAYRNFLFSAPGAEGLEDHLYWGILLGINVLHGPGKLSLDNALCYLWRRYR